MFTFPMGLFAVGKQIIQDVHSLWTWGRNNNAELGLGFQNYNRSSVVTTPVNDVTEWKQILTTSGVNPSMETVTHAIRSDGTLWAWGSSEAFWGEYPFWGGWGVYGKPVQLGSATDWLKIAKTKTGWLLLKTDNTVWTWGGNANGELGLGNTLPYSTPVQLVGGSNYVDIASQMILLSDGWVLSWGEGVTVGDGTTGGRATPVFVTWDGRSVHASPDGDTKYVNRVDDTIWAWGKNPDAQIGDGYIGDIAYPVQTTGTGFKKMSAGNGFAVALKGDNSVYSWGRNSNGRLGLGATTIADTPTVIPSELLTEVSVAFGKDAVLGITSSGTVRGWGQLSRYNAIGVSNSTTPVTIPMASGVQVKALSVGSREALFINTANHRALFGDNRYGQLGDDAVRYYPPTEVVSPAMEWGFGIDSSQSRIAMGLDFVMVIREDNTLWGWGRVLDPVSGNILIKHVPTQLHTEPVWDQVATNGFTVILTKTDGTLWGYGANGFGELGDNTTVPKSTPIQITGGFSPSRIVDIFIGGDSVGGYVIVLDALGRLWSWGNNTNGALGTNDTSHKYVPTRIGTDSDWASLPLRGGGHRTATFAFKTDGSLWAWGGNFSGQLGNGNQIQQNVPIQVGSAGVYDQVCNVSGATFTIRKDGTLWTWGRNDRGQLGHGDLTQRDNPTQVGSDTDWVSISAVRTGRRIDPATYWEDTVMAVKSDGTLWGWGSNTYFNVLGMTSGYLFNVLSPMQIGSDTNWKDISCGYAFVGIKEV